MKKSLRITIPSLLRIKENALHKVGKYLNLEKMDRVAVLWGEGIEELFGEKLSISFSSSDIDVLYKKMINTIEIRDCFENSIEMDGKINGIVAIGGGKVLDHAKYIAHIKKIPLMVVPTIISNDGICSSMSSLTVDGKRKTHRTTVPHAVVVDLNVIKAAPKSFLYSGIGDLICKGSSIYDWKLAYHRNKEYVDDFAVMTTQNAFDAFTHFHEKDLNNVEFIKIIVSSLIIVGVAMEVAGSSRPASGSEHLISHALDHISQRPQGHGIQVGVSAIVTSYLQNHCHQLVKDVLEESGFIDFVAENPLDRAEFINAIKEAPLIKDNFCTILSESGNIDRAIDFITNDSLMQRLIKG
ncbi:MAG: iron-containing alcohol dehydrogenase family protein [Bacteriovoracaceae bacterium]|nr:iron-containing alcohol dehydrogenase family protein [Bacteriovoracaceae bacterium]